MFVRTMAAMATCAVALLQAELAHAACGDPLCLDFVGTTATTTTSGDTEVIELTYTISDGSWTDLGIVVDVPEHFLGSYVRDVGEWNEGCALEPSGSSWNIVCEWDRKDEPAVFGAGQSETKTIELHVTSRRYQTPEGYEGAFSARIAGRRNGAPEEASAGHVMTVTGDARLQPYNLADNGVITVDRWIDGELVRGRLFPHTMLALNNVGTFANQVPGGNALTDVRITLDLPAYALLDRVDDPLGRWTYDGGALGTFGPQLDFTYAHALGSTGEATAWNTWDMTGVRSHVASAFTVFVFIPCAANGAKGWPGLPIDSGDEPFRVRYDANEVVFTDDASPPTLLAHTWPTNTTPGYEDATAPIWWVGTQTGTGTPVFDPASFILGPYNAGNCQPSLPGSGKNDLYTSSPTEPSHFPHGGYLNTFRIDYRAPSPSTSLGPTVVVDVLPPYHHLVAPADITIANSGENAGAARVFEAWVCKLPVTVTAPATAASATFGEPDSYRRAIDTTFTGVGAGFLDPQTWIGQPVPFPFDGTWGCVAPSEVVVGALADDACAPFTPGPGQRFCARDATAVVWSTGARAWAFVDDPNTAPIETNPNPHVPHLAVSLTTRIEWFDDAEVLGWVGGPDDALGANVTNIAYIYGGTFAEIITTGQPGNPTWDSMQDAYGAGLGTAVWIRNRPGVAVLATRMQAEIAVGEAGVIGCRFSGTRDTLALRDVRMTLTLPDGFRLREGYFVNGVGTWAYANGAVALLPGACDAALTAALSQYEVGVALSTNAVTFDLVDAPDLPLTACLTPPNRPLDSAFQAYVEPIPGFQFRDNEPAIFTCSVAADNLTDRDNQPRVVSDTESVQVPTGEGMRLDIDPACATGPWPTFDLRYHNIDGTDLAGAFAIFEVPQATTPNPDAPGAPTVPLVFAGAELLSHLGTATLLYTTDGPPSTPSWSPVAPDPALVRAVKVDFGANVLPAWDATGHLRVTLRPQGAGLDQIGQWIRASGNYGSTLLGDVRGSPSEVAFLGECPVQLAVRKFHDLDEDGVMGDGEPPLEGFEFALDVTVDSPIASAATRPNPPADPGGPPVFVDASDDRRETSNNDGYVWFSVWPGQTVSVTEQLPGAIALIVGDEANSIDWGSPASSYGVADTITWTATAGTTRVLAVGFDDVLTAQVGNRCACFTDDLCFDGECTAAGICEFTAKATSCTQSDACFAAVGACNPATGACVYDNVGCALGDPTRVFIMLEDTATQQVAGALVCEYDDTVTPATLDCTDDQGELVIDASLTCGSQP